MLSFAGGRRRGLASSGVSEKTLKVVASGLAILIILLLATIVYPLSPRGPAQINTASSSSAASTQSPIVIGRQVLSRVDQFSSSLGNRSAQTLTSFYSSSAVTSWSGNVQGLTNGGASLGGTYRGAENVSAVLASFIGRASNPWVERLSNTTIQFGSDSVNSTFDLFFFGINTAGSVFNSTARVQQEWTQSGSGTSWLIQSEEWDFLNFTLLSSSGTPWVAGNSLPSDIQGESCVTVSGYYVYCVGGLLHGQAGEAAPSYFDFISSTFAEVPSPWVATTPYPIAVSNPSCVAFSEAIFCVGGATSSGATDAIYSAPIYPSSIGGWVDVSSYPLEISNTSCIVQPFNGVHGFFICVGGREANGTETDSVHDTDLFYRNNTAPATIGVWDATPTHLPPYPTAIEGTSCVFSYGIYCVGYGERLIPQLDVSN